MTSKDRKDMLGFIAQNIEAKVDEEYTQPIFDDLDRLLTMVSDERQEEAELLVGEIRDRVTAVSTATLRYVLQHAAIRVEWEVRPEQDEAATAGEEQGNNITLKQDEAAPHQDTLTVGPSIQELAERSRVAAGGDGRGPKLAIKTNNASTRSSCALCPESGFRAAPELELFLHDSYDVVCWDCGRKYAPELVALLVAWHGVDSQHCF